jgi:hypothetical protein
MVMETIEEIVREMRKDIPRVVDAKVILRNYADRIEAAGKSLIADRDNWRRQALDEDARANAATCEKSSQVGNAAALRDAVKSLLYLLCDNGIDEETVMISHKNSVLRESLHTDRTLEILRKAKTALSTHPRNCDMPSVLKNPIAAWLDDHDNWDEFGDPKKSHAEWLLDKAKGK